MSFFSSSLDLIFEVNFSFVQQTIFLGHTIDVTFSELQGLYLEWPFFPPKKLANYLNYLASLVLDTIKGVFNKNDGLFPD